MVFPRGVLGPVRNSTGVDQNRGAGVLLFQQCQPGLEACLCMPVVDFAGRVQALRQPIYEATNLRNYRLDLGGEKNFGRIKKPSSLYRSRCLG